MENENENRAQEFYERGLALAKGNADDLSRAEACLGDAAERGHAEAMLALARMRLGLSRRAKMDDEGNIVAGVEADADPNEALELLTRAVEGGCDAARVELEKLRTHMPTDPIEGRDGVLYSPDRTVVWRGPRGVKIVHIEPTAVRIAQDAFAGCLELERIEFPEGLREIDDGAFDSCVRLTEIVLPPGMKNIGARAFRQCASLKSMTLPKGLLIIFEGTFEGCAKLKEVAIPQSVVMIGRRAFAGCTLLERIELPRTIERIAGDAFRNCLILNLVRITPDKPQFPGQLEAVSFHDIVETARERKPEEWLTRVPPDDVPRAIFRRARPPREAMTMSRGAPKIPNIRNVPTFYCLEGDHQMTYREKVESLAMFIHLVSESPTLAQFSLNCVLNGIGEKARPEYLSDRILPFLNCTVEWPLVKYKLQLRRLLPKLALFYAEMKERKCM